MVFGRKNRDLETRLEKLEARLDRLVELMVKEREREREPEDDNKVESKVTDPLDLEILELRKMARKAKTAEIARLKRTIQRFLENQKKLREYEETIEPEPEIPVQTVANPDGSMPDLQEIFRNPMIRIMANSFLRQFGTSIDELQRDPSKLIDLLEKITTTLKQKKAEAEAKGEPFNPYDPMLFMNR